MNAERRLRRLLSDAVSDIEPRDRLAEIRASVHPDPQVVPMSRPRPWLYDARRSGSERRRDRCDRLHHDGVLGPDDTGDWARARAGTPAPGQHRDRDRLPGHGRVLTVDLDLAGHDRREGVRRLLRRCQRRGQAGALPGVAPGAEPADPDPAATGATC